jgi:hypothetical protein
MARPLEHKCGEWLSIPTLTGPTVSFEASHQGFGFNLVSLQKLLHSAITEQALKQIAQAVAVVGSAATSARAVASLEHCPRQQLLARKRESAQA